jgi:hypothetical protein
MTIKLHRCPVMFAKSSGHPCWKVQKALDEAGIAYEVVEQPLCKSKRTDFAARSGQRLLPAIELDDGSILREESSKLAARVRDGRLPRSHDTANRGRRCVKRAAVVLVFLLAGCGSDTTAGRHRPAAPRPLIISEHAEHVVALRKVKQAAIGAPNASWLVAYKGSIWVKRDDGYIVRIDPRTNRSTGRSGSFTGQEDYCQGIAAGADAVWSCERHAVTRIDPRTMRVTARIRVGKVFDEGRYSIVHGRLWVITGTNGNQLTGIDPATGRTGRPIQLPYGCSDLARGGDAVWVLCPLSGHIVKVDVGHRRAVGVAAIPSTFNGYATRTDLWVGSAADLVRIDASTLRPAAVFRNAGPGEEGDVAVDGGDVWVSTSDGPLYKIDAATNTVLERIATPRGLRGGAIIVAAGSLWTTPGSDGPVLRIRAR